MEDVADSAADDGSSMDEEESDEDDVHDGIPVQGSTIGDVDPKLPTPTDSYKHLKAPTNSNQQAAPTDEATYIQLPTVTDRKPRHNYGQF
jgi:hypothetical protein